MNTSILYEICNSSNMKLIPISNLHDTDIENLISANNLDINNFYKVEGKLFPYCYMKDMVLIEIYDMSQEFFEKFKVKDMIKIRTEYFQSCISDKDYNKLFTLIDKPFRLKWFKKLYNDIPEELRLKTFKFIYSHMEYGFNNISKDMIIDLYKDYNFDKSHFDDVITIYRGETYKSTNYIDAYSWTLNLDVAKWFANRFNSKGKVYKGKIRKENIIDYIDYRNEKEIIVLSENIFDIEEI